MNRADYDGLIAALTASRRRDHEAKSADYAASGDVLKNFKWVAEMTGQTPEEVWAVYAAKHWLAVMRHIRDGTLASEPIEGRIADLLNYLELLWALMND